MQANTTDEPAGMFQKIKSSFQEIFGGASDSLRSETESAADKVVVPAAK